MYRHLVSTQNLERVLSDAKKNAITKAAKDELSRLREMNHYLMTYLSAVKRQTDSSLASVVSLIGDANPDPTACLLD
jgi:hypothetical protein